MRPFEATADLPQAATLLEASAGTGKTYTITSLLLRLVAEEGRELPRILVVTFTRAATGELRDRIRRRLTAAIDALARDEEPDDDVVTVLHRCDPEERARRRARLVTARAQLDEATISTIHGFCQRMLAQGALSAGVDFDAELLADESDLLGEAVDDFIAGQLRHVDAATYRFLREDCKLTREVLTGLARAATAQHDLRIVPQLDDALVDGDLFATWRAALEELRTVWAAWRGRLDDWLETFAGDCTPRQLTYKPKKAQQRAEAVDAWLAADHPLPDTDALGEGGALAYFTSAGITEKLAEGCAPPADHPLVAAADALRAAAGHPHAAMRVRFARWIREEVARRKAQRRVLSYEDLLARLAEALETGESADAIRTGIRRRYDVALIDEFQDTDPVQWRIFRRLFDTEEPLTLIGDPKQAIYAFRGADVQTYLAARDHAAEHYTLATNHRSDEAYVDACNRLFDLPGVFGEDGIAYRRVEAAHGDRLALPGTAPPLELRYLPMSLAADHDGLSRKCITKGWIERPIAEDVAGQVVVHLTAGATIPDEESGAARPVEPRDLAVLVRTNRQAGQVQRALRAAGVPAVIHGVGSVFAAPEAEWLGRLLEALLRPGYERTARAAAASPLFDLDALDLAGDTVDEAQPPAEEDLAGARRTTEQRWDAFVAELHDWAARWERDGIMRALRHLFATAGTTERLLRAPGGERAVMNLWHLAELLHAAEVGDRLGPAALAGWLRARRAEPDEDDEGQLLRLESDADAVSVVTVHRSKGLEYPIVLCPYLWDGTLLRADGKAHLRFHDPDDRMLTLDLGADDGSQRRRAHLALAEREAQAEGMRLLYVALTRARHRCVVWWARATSSETSPLATILHGRGDVADRFTAAAERLKGADDERILGDLETLRDAAQGRIGLTALEKLPEPGEWSRREGDGELLVARRYERGPLDTTWGRASFTSLTRRRATAAPADDDPMALGRDVDAGTGTAHVAAVAVPDDAPDVPLVDFPAGAGPGTFLHAVLEHLDFTAADDDAVLMPLLDDLERRHGIPAGHRPALMVGLRAALAAPLGGVLDGVALRDVGRGDRLDELEFELPLAGGTRTETRGHVDLAGLADLLRAHPAALGAPSADYVDRLAAGDELVVRRVRGFLTGSIDLVARVPVDGRPRYLVVDYKSNWLGEREPRRSTAWHYHPGALAEAMEHHHYVVQHHLYVVALHRYLAWRLGADYDYDRDVAGVRYAFLRGMTGDRSDGEPCGVFAARPPKALVEALSAYLDDPASRAVGGRRG